MIPCCHLPRHRDGPLKSATRRMLFRLTQRYRRESVTRLSAQVECKALDSGFYERSVCLSSVVSSVYAPGRLPEACLSYIIQGTRTFSLSQPTIYRWHTPPLGGFSPLQASLGSRVPEWQYRALKSAGGLPRAA